MSAPLLKLRAADKEDIQIISAVLQDAIVPLCDMTFQVSDHNFVMVAQRLRREVADKQTELERICCALTLTGVTGVQTQGIDFNASGRILDLLAILVSEQAGEPQVSMSLIFAGDARIRLELAAWSAQAEDFGEPWPVQCAPCHEAS